MLVSLLQQAITQLNGVKRWEFNGVDIADSNKNNLLLIWIIIPILIIIGVLVFFLVYRKIKRRMEIQEDTYPRIEDQIQHSSMAPKKYRLKELMKQQVDSAIRTSLVRVDLELFIRESLEKSIKR